VEVLRTPARDMDLAAVLAEDAAQFGAFLLSFVVIARLWLAHHRLVERVGAYDSAFVLVNLGWVLTVVLLPFATQVLAVYGTDRPAIATYIGTMTASSACLSVLSVLVWQRPSLAAREPAPTRATSGEPSHPIAILTTTRDENPDDPRHDHRGERSGLIDDALGALDTHNEVSARKRTTVPTVRRGRWKCPAHSMVTTSPGARAASCSAVSRLSAATCLHSSLRRCPRGSRGSSKSTAVIASSTQSSSAERDGDASVAADAGQKVS
jgi:hypothetical protein